MRCAAGTGACGPTLTRRCRNGRTSTAGCRCGPRLLDLRHPYLADNASGDRHGLLRALWFHSGTGHHADPRHGRTCVGIGLQRGTRTRWQLVANDGVLTLYIAAQPNCSPVWVRVVDEVSGAILKQ